MSARSSNDRKLWAAGSPGTPKSLWGTVNMTDTNVKVICSRNAVEIAWSCGSRSTLPHLWLRDNCDCSDCRIEQTSEKKFIITEVSVDIAPADFEPTRYSYRAFLSDDSLAARAIVSKIMSFTMHVLNSVRAGTRCPSTRTSRRGHWSILSRWSEIFSRASQFRAIDMYKRKMLREK